MDQGNDIEIPIIEIAEGWTVDEIKTLDDCDDAYAYLIGATCAIQEKIDAAEIDGTDQGYKFYRLKSALRWKKAAMQVVQTKRGRITREENRKRQESHDNLLLKKIRELYPNEFSNAICFMKGSPGDSNA